MSTSPVTLDFSKLQPIQGQQGTTAPAMVSTGTVGNPNTGVAQAPTPSPANTNAPQGVTLDFSKLQSIDGSGSAASTQDSDSSVGQAIQNATSGIVEGGLNTLGGLADVGDKIGDKIEAVTGLPASGHGALGRVLNDAADYMHNAGGGDNSTARKVGYGGETLAEFLMGDEALKGLAMSEKLMQTAKTMRIFEKSPKLMAALKIGAQALRTGTVAGTQTFARTGGDVGDAAETGALTGAGGAALSGAVSAARAIPALFSVGEGAESIQPTLQQGIRNVLDTVAKDAGVTPSPSASIRDVAGQVADSVEAKSKGIYQQLDDATGGRFQRFEDKLRNINRQLRETVDDDQESALEQKRNEIETSQAQAFEDAKAAGVDPALVDKARLTWKQAKALTDLSTQIQRSTEGVRPELAPPGSLNPETVNPTKVSTRLNNLYDSGRLQDAVGPDQARQIVQHADNAVSDTKRVADRAAKVASRKRALKTAAKIAGAGTLAAGGVGEGIRALTH